MTLTCPKCQGEWRQYERNGVTIDQCTECRGVFLDRGELDRLIDAENAFYDQDANAPAPVAAPDAPPQAPATPQAPPTAPQAPPPAPSYGQPSTPQYSPPPAYGGAPQSYPPQSYPPAQPGYGYPSHGHKKRKKSFLDELFD